jgi:hypothetical protein
MKSKSMADQGLGMERASRVEENRALAVERIAESQNQRSLAVYHEIKAAQELETMDLTHLEKLFTLVHNLQEAKRAREVHDREMQQPLEAPEQNVAKQTAVA